MTPRTVAIMQPTYLPWIGYFALMDQVDTFIFLDSVQFDKRSWQQRNRIKTRQGEQYLTVPVITKGRRDQKILDVEIDSTQKFQKKHLSAIKANYSKAQFFTQYWPEIENIFQQSPNKLVDLNLALIEWFVKKLGIETPLMRSSELENKGSKAELLYNLCRQVDGTVYFSPQGSKVYLDEHNPFAGSSIELVYHDYEHPIYKQMYPEFIPYISVIDLLMNEGGKSKDFLLSGNS